MVSQRQQLLPLLRLALEQAFKEETLHLKGPLILLPCIPRSFLLGCNLHQKLTRGANFIALENSLRVGSCAGHKVRTSRDRMQCSAYVKEPCHHMLPVAAMGSTWCP